jgi:hypothetical protein
MCRYQEPKIRRHPRDRLFGTDNGGELLELDSEGLLPGWCHHRFFGVFTLTLTLSLAGRGNFFYLFFNGTLTFFLKTSTG